MRFLKMMGFDELIADDLEAYIELAVKIGQDQAMRERIRAEIPKRLPRVYGDLECILALEQFLRQAVTSYQLPMPSSSDGMSS